MTGTVVIRVFDASLLMEDFFGEVPCAKLLLCVVELWSDKAKGEVIREKEAFVASERLLPFCEEILLPFSLKDSEVNLPAGKVMDALDSAPSVLSVPSLCRYTVTDSSPSIRGST